MPAWSPAQSCVRDAADVLDGPWDIGPASGELVSMLLCGARLESLIERMCVLCGTEQDRQ